MCALTLHHVISAPPHSHPTYPSHLFLFLPFDIPPLVSIKTLHSASSSTSLFVAAPQQDGATALGWLGSMGDGQQMRPPLPPKDLLLAAFATKRDTLPSSEIFLERYSP